MTYAFLGAALTAGFLILSGCQDGCYESGSGITLLYDVVIIAIFDNFACLCGVQH